MPEMPGGPWPDEAVQKAEDLEAQLAAEDLGVFDPATKSPNADNHTERVGEVSLDSAQSDKPPSGGFSG
jgi:hypothetical protein